jgi:hypothetical protein
MFSPKGNPQARNLLDVICKLQNAEQVEIEVRLSSTRSRTATDRRKPALPTDERSSA